MFTRMMRLGTVAAVLLLVTPLRAEIIEQVLVRVNGEVITLSEYEKIQVQFLANRPELAKLPPNSPQLSRAVEESAPTLILGAVDELLLLQRAREHGWAISEDHFKRVIGDIRKSNNLDDDEAFKKALAAEGMTEADLRKSIEREILIRQVRQVDITEKINVTEEEVRAYYDANSKEFIQPAEITLREILIPVPVSDRGINVAEDDAAREKAEELRKRLLAGESAATIATEFSAAASKVNGGLVGPLKVDELAPELQAVVQPLRIGQPSDVLKMAGGYRIFVLDSRSETKVRTLEEARGDVARRVAEQKSRGETLRYLEQLRDQAKIVWRHDELQKAYDKALAERRATVASLKS